MIIRKYYKLIPWTQPTLVAAGTMGGNEMAVNSKKTKGSSFSNNGTYQAFYPNTKEIFADTNEGLSTMQIAVYLPEPFVITSIQIKTSSSNHGNSGYGPSGAHNCILYGGDSEYTVDAVLGKNTKIAEGKTGTIDVYQNMEDYVKQKGFQYYTLQLSTGGSANEDTIWVSNILVSGSIRREVTEQDEWDYYVDTDTWAPCKVPTIPKRLYYKYDTTRPSYNYTAVGSLTNNNGVLSGFSSSKYGKIPDVPSGVSSYEIGCKFTTGAINSEQHGIIANTTTNIHTPQIIIGSGNCIEFGHPDSSYNWTGYCTGGTLSADTTYWVKGIWDGEYTYLYLKTAQDEDYSLIVSGTCNSLGWDEQLGIGIDRTSHPFNGSIDLNECYVNINGKPWWKGVTYPIIEGTSSDYDFYKDMVQPKTTTKVVRKYYKYGTTLNAIINGSPTINQGVVSGFNSSNFLTIPDFWNGSLGDTFEMVWKFNLSQVGKKSQQIFAISSRPAYNPWIGVQNGNVIRARLATNTSGSTLVDLSGTTVLTTDTDYWLKFEFTGTQYNLYLSTDGTNYNLEAQKASTAKWTTYKLSWIGKGGDDVALYPLYGSIDFTESYIKIDGKYWWHGTKVEESDSSDYDFYKDVTVCNCFR